MEFIISSVADHDEEQTIISNLWEYNSHVTPVDIQPLRIIVKNERKEIIGGVIARTWWGGLDIQYLWVAQAHRKMGIGKKLMQSVQQEALTRCCHMAYVDTFSFQALGFYQRLGFSKYGELAGFAHRHTRYYLSKSLTIDASSLSPLQDHNNDGK